MHKHEIVLTKIQMSESCDNYVTLFAVASADGACVTRSSPNKFSAVEWRTHPCCALGHQQIADVICEMSITHTHKRLCTLKLEFCNRIKSHFAICRLAQHDQSEKAHRTDVIMTIWSILVRKMRQSDMDSEVHAIHIHPTDDYISHENPKLSDVTFTAAGARNVGKWQISNASIITNS